MCAFSTSSLWRGHEGDRSSHKQTVRWGLGGLRVTLHTLYWLSLGAGGGRCWRQEHQHLLQLENGFNSAISNRSEPLDQLICLLGIDLPAPKTVRTKSTNSGLTSYKLEKDCESQLPYKWVSKFSNQLTCQVVRFILTLTTWWNASFDTWQQPKGTEDITKHKYSVKGKEKLSIMGNEGLWKTSWRTFFPWGDSNHILIVFFSTENPYLIAGRTNWSKGSSVISRFSWTRLRAASRDKLLCRGFWFWS